MTTALESLLETMPSASSPEWSDAQIGRYRFVRLVGAGGMGVVVAAHDPDLDREVAIKVIATGDHDDARPVREAQAMARLSHPNVVQVYEVIRLGARTAIVMELVEGPDLAIWQSEPRSWREIIDVYLQASRGLAAAHRAGIVHRDFKPSNVLIDRHGVVRVTDFGVARREATDDHAGVAGTPVYMAPEAHRGGVVDARTDQWALACSLSEALFRRRPFASAEAGDLAAAVARGAIDDEPVDTPVPRRIRAAIRRALAPQPDDRFASIDDFAAALTIPSRRAPYAIAAALAIVAAFAIWNFSRPSTSTCEGLAAPMQAVWTDAVRAALRARLLAPDIGVPAPAVDAALAGLDSYATRWGEARTHACTDTQHGARSAASLDTRMRCLDHRLSGVTGLLDALAAGDPATLRATRDAVLQLPAIEACADEADPIARPATPALRDEVEGAERGLARATALMSLSQFEQALPLAAQAITAGTHAAAPAVVARALVVRGECEDRLAKAVDALASYQEAARTAARAQDHVVIADALTRSFLVEGNHLGRRADALRSRPYIELAVESAGQPDAVRAQWLHFLAIILYDDPSLRDEALRDEEESLAIRQRTLPAGHVYILDSLETLGNIEAAAKNFDKARTLLTTVLDARTAARGPRDRAVASAFNNLAIIEFLRGDLLAAIPYFERAITTAAASGQPNLHAEANLAISQLEIGRVRAAATGFAAALQRTERLLGPGSIDTAIAATNLGVAWIAMDDVARGGPMLLRGVDASRSTGSPTLATALSHAARLALRTHDTPRARALVAEIAKLSVTNPALHELVLAELSRAEAGCPVALPALEKVYDRATAEGEHLVISFAVLDLAECEIATGATAAARTHLETELLRLQKATADDEVIARVRALLAKL